MIAKLEAKAGDAGITYVALAATPKAKTLETFGRLADPSKPKGEDNLPQPFHVYSMQQAFEEEFILDVLLNYTTYKLAFKLANNGKVWDEHLRRGLWITWKIIRCGRRRRGLCLSDAWQTHQSCDDSREVRDACRRHRVAEILEHSTRELRNRPDGRGRSYQACAWFVNSPAIAIKHYALMRKTDYLDAGSKSADKRAEAWHGNEQNGAEIETPKRETPSNFVGLVAEAGLEPARGITLPGF